MAVTTPPVIPCTSCLHDPICVLRPLLRLTELEERRQELDPALRVISKVDRIECDHYLAVREPEPIRREYGGESWRTQQAAPEAPAAPSRRHPSHKAEEASKRQRAADALAALERHGGDRKAAAAELGMRGNAFAMVLKYASRRQPEGATA